MRPSYRPREKSALIFVLKGLIPYTRENVMLSFRPNQFFNELERISRYKRRTLELAMQEAERQKLIEKHAHIIRLTERGKSRVRPFVAEHLPSNGRLMVIFDIPEEIKVTRARFRRALRAWQFEQVQKSVWITSYDHRRSIKELVAEMDIEEFVKLYECAAI